MKKSFRSFLITVCLFLGGGSWSSMNFVYATLHYNTSSAPTDADLIIQLLKENCSDSEESDSANRQYFYTTKSIELRGADEHNHDRVPQELPARTAGFLYCKNTVKKFDGDHGGTYSRIVPTWSIKWNEHEPSDRLNRKDGNEEKSIRHLLMNAQLKTPSVVLITELEYKHVLQHGYLRTMGPVDPTSVRATLAAFAPGATGTPTQPQAFGFMSAPSSEKTKTRRFQELHERWNEQFNRLMTPRGLQRNLEDEIYEFQSTAGVMSSSLALDLYSVVLDGPNRNHLLQGLASGDVHYFARSETGGHCPEGLRRKLLPKFEDLGMSVEELMGVPLSELFRLAAEALPPLGKLHPDLEFTDSPEGFFKFLQEIFGPSAKKDPTSIQIRQLHQIVQQQVLDANKPLTFFSEYEWTLQRSTDGTIVPRSLNYTHRLFSQLRAKDLKKIIKREVNPELIRARGIVPELSFLVTVPELSFLVRHADDAAIKGFCRGSQVLARQLVKNFLSSSKSGGFLYGDGSLKVLPERKKAWMRAAGVKIESLCGDIVEE